MRGRRDGLSGELRGLGLTVLCMLVMQGITAGGLRGQSGGRALLRGEVIDYETGLALAEASVTLAGGEDSADFQRTELTDSAGVFGFPSVPAGRYHLSVVALGYTPVHDTLEVAEGARVELVVPMSVSPLELKPVVVELTPVPLGPLRDFERRRRAHYGTFFTRAEIEASNAVEFTDLVRTVPGARMVSAGPFRQRLVFRGGCRPDLWVDGTLVGNTVDMDAYLDPHDLEAVEIYRGANLPGEFGANLCGAVVAWTRRGDPAPTRKSLKTQLLFASGIVAAFLLIHR